MMRCSDTASPPRLLAVCSFAFVFHVGCVATSSDAANDSKSVTKSDKDSGADDERVGSETSEAATTPVVAHDDPSDAPNSEPSSEPSDATEMVTATEMGSEDEVDGGGTAIHSPETTSDVEETDELSADAGAAHPDCTSVCVQLVDGCGGTLKNCVDECERDAVHSASCGQQGAWSVLLACCARASWDGCDEQSFDACQHDACGSLRPEGAAEGCGQALCGNGELDADEVCDDGNTTSGDGCSGDCSHIEPAW